MVKINQINLSDFRNFKNLSLSFHRNTNIFFGDNGSGKTNILESISLISKGRGLRNASIVNLIKNNEKSFLLKAFLDINNNIYNIKILSEKNDSKFKKIIKVNDDASFESIKFLNSSISFLFFLPEMERLFQSSPSHRRNFIDRLIYSENNEYSKLINRYKKDIIERNKILQQNNFDLDWIKHIENQISINGLKIYQLRKSQLNKLNRHIKNLNHSNNYHFEINLSVKDDFFTINLNEERYLSELYNSRNLDRKLGGCVIGPHKSDLIAKINDEYEASLLSTGQQKTVVLLVLLAQCDYLVNIKKKVPVLLLDEICSHLDSNNRKILLDMINQFDIQFFLTGTDKTLFSFISTNVEFYNITDLYEH